MRSILCCLAAGRGVPTVDNSTPTPTLPKQRNTTRASVGHMSSRLARPAWHLSRLTPDGEMEFGTTVETLDSLHASAANINIQVLSDFSRQCAHSALARWKASSCRSPTSFQLGISVGKI
ncbi:hypothetical protein N657DRAFT_158907 [Parathielavia appendiculata]|uniref:Uncharacterized protein n=1 Tax=Parathielavia appendiculata TaxID=2587402 RepID=A0AAN6Z1B3_9PEZI|nr:hypothetical protein N657DRAFT_158907 [Parathielavia appendiculata]